MPFFLGFNSEIASEPVREVLAGLIPSHTIFILGAERREGLLTVEERYTFNRVYNSLFVLGEGAKILSIYDKTHLVPFGEYVPLRGMLTAVGMHAFSHLLNGFDAGQKQASAIRAPQAPDFLPLICYEIIFPGRVANLRERPGWFVNVTNDAWFGEFDRSLSTPPPSPNPGHGRRFAGHASGKHRDFRSYRSLWKGFSSIGLG